MRPSTASLIKVQPLPASSFAWVRLPPSSSSRVARSGTQPLSQSRSDPDQKKQETVAHYLAQQATGVAARKDAPWPSNLRIEEHVNKKELYWKVSKPQRDILVKQLREA